MSDLRGAIADLVHRYADAVVHRDPEQWISCWADDARWVLGAGREVSGRDDILDLWTRAMAGFESVSQHVHNGTARAAGDGAEGRWYIAEHFRRAPDQDGVGQVGILLAYYDDTYVQRDGQWHFASRELVPQYQGPPDLSAAFTNP